MRKIAADIYGGAFRDDPNLINAHAQNMKGASDLGYLYQLLALTGWSSLPWLHKLIQPTLVLMGNVAPIVPLINGQILTRLIRGARLQIMQDGHLFFVTKPQETALIVARFIAEGCVHIDRIRRSPLMCWLGVRRGCYKSNSLT